MLCEQIGEWLRISNAGCRRCAAQVLNAFRPSGYLLVAIRLLIADECHLANVDAKQMKVRFLRPPPQRQRDRLAVLLPRRRSSISIARPRTLISPPGSCGPVTMLCSRIRSSRARSAALRDFHIIERRYRSHGSRGWQHQFDTGPHAEVMDHGFGDAVPCRP